MASIAMLIGGALVNALAFSGSNYLFTILRSSDVDEERKRHDKAVQQLQATQASMSRKQTERLDWINEELRRQGHAVKTFRDVDATMQEYVQVTGHNLDPLGPEPQLTDFYHPSDGQKDCEIAFVILGMAATDCGLPTRQEVRPVLILSLFSATLYHGSSRRALQPIA